MFFNFGKSVFPPDRGDFDEEYDNEFDEEYAEELADGFDLFDQEEYGRYIYTDNEEDI